MAGEGDNSGYVYMKIESSSLINHPNSAHSIIVQRHPLYSVIENTQVELYY